MSYVLAPHAFCVAHSYTNFFSVFGVEKYFCSAYIAAFCVLEKKKCVLCGK